jgi:beta-lactamase regulating signal transducer with metallopeptidase domain
MTVYYDAVLFAIRLAVNLVLLGSIIACGLAVSFRLIENVSPRLRYVISVAAFLIATFVPVAVTLDATFDQITLSNSSFKTRRNTGVEHSIEQDGLLLREAPLFDFVSASAISKTNLLSDFILSVSDSWLGVIFLSLWVVGAVYFLSLDAVAYWPLRKIQEGWQPATDAERKDLLCPENVPLYFDEHESPGTVGLLNPVVVLPKCFPDDMFPDSRRYIVQHEVAHAQWRDPLVNYLLRLIRSLFWISPALWLLEGFAKTEREAAADRAALLKFSTNKAEAEAAALKFAATLVSAAKNFNSFGRHNHFKPQTTGIGGGCELEARVRRLLAFSSQTSRARIALAAMTFIICLTATTVIPLASQPIKSNTTELSLGEKRISPLIEGTLVGNSEITERPTFETSSTLVSSGAEAQTSSPPDPDKIKREVNTRHSEKSAVGVKSGESPVSVLSGESPKSAGSPAPERTPTSFKSSINSLDEKVRRLGALNSELELKIHKLSLELTRTRDSLGNTY